MTQALMVNAITGRVQRFSVLAPDPVARLDEIATAGGWTGWLENPDGWSDETHYAPGGVVTLRPAPPAPPALTAGVEAVWSGLPPLAVVTVSDPVTGPAGFAAADAGGALPLRIDVAGPWLIAVAEVWPVLAGSWSVEVAP